MTVVVNHHHHGFSPAGRNRAVPDCGDGEGDHEAIAGHANLAETCSAIAMTSGSAASLWSERKARAVSTVGECCKVRKTISLPESIADLFSGPSTNRAEARSNATPRPALTISSMVWMLSTSCTAFRLKPALRHMS